MSIDYGLAIVIVAVLIFYLRLIILQRQRAKQLRNQNQRRKTAGSKKSILEKDSGIRYSIISPHPRDRAIGIIGLVMAIFGLLLYGRILYIPIAQPYWWILTSSGVVAFSWLFRL